MDILLLGKAIILGIVEGLTEFLPVSSTGHLIVAGSLLGFVGEKANTFEIAIQSGAMCAVIWEYRQRLIATIRGIANQEQARRFAVNVIVAFIPAAVIGLAFSKLIKSHLFHPVPVAIAFVVGAMVILWVEARQQKILGAVDSGYVRRSRIETVDEMQPLDALKVGLAQCLALIPGTSRSGSTIMGGMLFGLSRKAATEFSFYLAIPTLMAAGAYEMWKARAELHAADWPLFTVGTVVAFISALLCIRWLIRYISTHDFTLFAWYRIFFGAVILLTWYFGLVQWQT